MIAAQVPELADGGYWYVVEADTTDGRSPPESIGDGWCAQYGTVGGTIYAVIRTPVPRTVPPISVTSADVIAAAVLAGSLPVAEKFYARVGGA